jgi:UDP-N-acetylglucosamine 2-epimerase (non-hydrolysing)
MTVGVTKRIHLVVAARPNFMKIAPLYHALKKAPWCEPVLVHTGQHYDAALSDAFIRDLALPAPDHHLGIGSGTHAEQTGAAMIAYERLCARDRPDLCVVAGDVNSTLACALAAKKLLITVGHLEAGLRSRDWTMPEEVNRIVTDTISDILWTPSEDADANLAQEGVAAERISRVGNIMLDSYELLRPKIEAMPAAARFGFQPGGYGVITLHRPANVDDAATLAGLLAALLHIAERLPLVFPAHPRTQKALTQSGLHGRIASASGLRIVEPLGYIEFMAMVRGARLAITDSGGIQEETSYLGVPCLTLRSNTERPITITHGTNRLVETSQIEDAVTRVLTGKWPKGRSIALWDGKTAERILADLSRRLQP